MVIHQFVVCKAVKFATAIFIAQGIETHVYIAYILPAILILFNIKLKLIAVSIYYNPIVTQYYCVWCLSSKCSMNIMIAIIKTQSIDRC